MPVNQNNTTLLKFFGADAASFLQGQLTNDLNLPVDTWQFSGYCSPKGRLLALLQLWREGDDIYALIDSSLVEVTLKRLRMYVMRSKVTIEIINNVTISAIFDQESPKFSLTSDSESRLLHHGSRALRIDFDSGTAMAPTAENRISWQLSCITAGEPTIDANNVELFVPQMVNLDLLDGINFKKGCYTGQEIVARMHYLGKLKQRMFICDIQGHDTSTSCSGDKVVSIIDGAERNAGNVVSVAEDKALVVLRIEMIDAALQTESGCHLIVSQHQAYEIPDLS